MVNIHNHTQVWAPLIDLAYGSDGLEIQRSKRNYWKLVEEKILEKVQKGVAVPSLFKAPYECKIIMRLTRTVWQREYKPTEALIRNSCIVNT